eukprot:6173836-Pleurochrysis_carterae.AAC.2
MIKEEEELALRQTISGIIPEWQQVDDKRKKGAIKRRMNIKPVYSDNRGNMLKMFTRWKRNVGYKQDGLDEEQGKENEEGKKEKTYGIKYWGRCDHQHYATKCEFGAGKWHEKEHPSTTGKCYHQNLYHAVLTRAATEWEMHLASSLLTYIR